MNLRRRLTGPYELLATTIEPGAAEAERLRSVVDVAAMMLQRLRDDGLFHDEKHGHVGLLAARGRNCLLASPRFPGQYLSEDVSRSASPGFQNFGWRGDSARITPAS